MGVDYYVCNDCSDTYPDCGPCGYCSCDRGYCGYCFDQLRAKYGIWSDEDEDNPDRYEDGYLKKCDFCSLEKINDYDLLNFLLKKLELSRKQAEEEYRIQNISKKKSKK